MHSSNNKLYGCWLLIALFYLLENCLQASQGIFASTLKIDLSLSSLQLDFMTQAYFFTYGLMQIPVGLTLDKYGLKRPLLLAVFACALGAYVMAAASGYYLSLFGRILIAFGSAFAVLSSFNYCAMFLPANKFATLTGALLTIGMSGQILGEAPLLKLIETVGWRQSLLLIGGAIFLLNIGLFCLIPAKKPVKTGVKKAGHEFKQKLITTLKNKYYWQVAIYGMLRFTPFILFVSYLGHKILINLHNLSAVESAAAVGMLPLGFAIGAPIWGRFSDKTGKRLPTLIISNILEIILWCMLCLHWTYFSLNILCCALGFMVSGFLPAFTVMKETAPATIQTTALGFMNTLNSIGLPLILPIISLIDITQHTIAATLILPTLTICASICFISLKEAN